MPSRRMLKNPVPARLLKKVQNTHPSDGYPAAGDPPNEAYFMYAAMSAPGTRLTGDQRRRWAFFSSLLEDGSPAVHRQRYPRDEGGGVRGEKEDGPGHFVRTAGAAQRTDLGPAGELGIHALF